MLSKKLKQIFKNSDSCFEDKKTVAEENQRKFILDLSNLPNQRKCCRIHVDNYLIKDKDIKMKKCDFWFHVSEKANAEIKDNFNVFVELKGQNVDQAFRQIISTIEWIRPKIGLIQSNCYAAIVASEVTQGTKSQNLKREFREKKYGKRLEIQAPQMTFRLL